MKPEDELLGACTRQSFTDAHRTKVSYIVHNNQLDWQVIYLTASQHGVAPLIFSNLRRCFGDGFKVPQAVMTQFQNSFLYNMAVKEHKAQQIVEAVDFFQQRGIDVMLIKGAALDLLVYEHPYYTISEDVDVVLNVKPEELTSKEKRRITERLHGMGIEFDYFEHHDITMNKILPVDFQQIWERAVKIQFRGRDVWIMSPEDMFVSACINSCRKRFFKLKSLCDISEIIMRCKTVDWDKMIRCAGGYQCESIVYGALYATNLVIGCELPDKIFNDFPIHFIKAATIRAMVAYLGHRRSLAAKYPFKHKNWFGRNVTTTLWLPYVTYQWDQILRKLILIPQRDFGSGTV